MQQQQEPTEDIPSLVVNIRTQDGDQHPRKVIKKFYLFHPR